jgi:predicted aminopeptidase
MHRALLALLVAPLLNGCATLGYYGHAIGGHYAIMGRAYPIDELIGNSGTDPALKQKLERIAAIRDFATRALALPDNASYRSYANLDRPFAVWNVVAAPELSLKPKESCFWVAGCVAYRGYFSREDAEREMRRLTDEGYDVTVGGVVAYSTLGWFDDPVLNTMLDRPEPDLAALLFHELSHQKVYVKDDTAFNESFATAVEREGVRRWLAAQNASTDYERFLERVRRHEQFVAFVLRYRERLENLYGSDANDERKRAGKHEIFESLRRDYTALKRQWNNYAGYDRWIDNANNAAIASVGLYHEHVPAFQALLARHAGDLPAFYRAVDALAREPKGARAKALRELTGEARQRP